MYQSIAKKLRKTSKQYDAFSKKIIGARSTASVSLLLIVVLVSLVYLDGEIKQQMYHFTLFSSPVSVANISLYPKLVSVLGETTAESSQRPLTDISAQGAVVLDDDSKTVIYSKNSGYRFSTASTAKIMTALVALSYFHKDDILTVKSNTSGSLVGFVPTEQLSFEDILYAMLLPSGNDAAKTIAQNYPGGEDAFVAKMNETAVLHHLINTHFSDPAGLDDNGDYTTPIDLARLASVAIQNKKIAEIVSTRERTIADISGKKIYKLYNLNKLLGQDGVNGIKTGFTDEAGGVLVTSKIEQGHTLILVVMKSVDRFADTQKLLDLISGNLQYVELSPAGSTRF